MGKRMSATVGQQNLAVAAIPSSRVSVFPTLAAGASTIELAPQAFDCTRGNFTVKVLRTTPTPSYYFFTLDFMSPFSSSPFTPQTGTSYRIGSAIDNLGNVLGVTYSVYSSGDFTVTTAAADGSRQYRIQFFGDGTGTSPTIYKVPAGSGGGAVLGVGTVTVSTLYSRPFY